MKKYLILAGVIVALGAGAFVIAQGFFPSFQASLISYEEVPAVSSVGSAEFRADLSPYGNQVNWELTYRGLEGNITQSHIHFGQRGVNGGIVVFLCSNLGNGPAGTQACPPSPATIRGTFSSTDVGAGANAQGIAAGEFAELLRAMRAGTTYVNVHSTIWPGGEVRSQISLPAQVTVIREQNGEEIADPTAKSEHIGH